MNQFDFTFDAPAWETALGTLPGGTSLSAARFLTMMEQEPEEDFEDALGLLDEKDILLDISDLPDPGTSGALAVRLRREEQLVKTGKLPQGLEENDPLRLYLEELAAIPVCGDPQLLAQRCREGDESAQLSLMNLMLSRVVDHAYGMAGRGVLLMDLIQEGSLGLWQSILNYRGGEFEPQCDRCIRRAQARAVVIQARENGVGQKMRQALEDYRAVDEQLLTQLGRNPTMEEIAAQLHMTLQEAETVAQMLDAARTVSRVKEAEKPREETAEEDMAVEDTAYFRMRQRITELLSILEERDAKLLTLRFGLEGGLPQTPEDVGKALGMTAEEVVAAESAALAKLRNEK